MAKPTTVKIRLVSTADTGFFYVTKKNPRTKTEKATSNGGMEYILFGEIPKVETLPLNLVNVSTALPMATRGLAPSSAWRGKRGGHRRRRFPTTEASK